MTNKGADTSSPCASCVFLPSCRKDVLSGEPAYCELESPMHKQYRAKYGRTWPGGAYWDLEYWLMLNDVPLHDVRKLHTEVDYEKV